MIHPALAHLVRPLSDASPHPANDHEADIGALCHQLQTHGQHKPILVQASTGLIVAGNHRWKAAQMLGWTELAMAFLELDDAEALEVLVSDNYAAEQARDDERALEDVLARLHAAGRIERSGYTADDLDDLVRARLMAERAGSMPEPRATEPGLPVVKAKVPPSTYERWCSLVASTGLPEAALFARLVADATADRR